MKLLNSALMFPHFRVRLINRTDPVSGVIEKAAVEKIMAKRMNPRKRENEYLVKWESKPQTWEPASHLESCKDLIENFEVLLAKQKEMRSKSQQQQQQQMQQIVKVQPSATSTPTSVATTTPGRPVRFSKEKAINQVKQWTGGNKHDGSAESSGGKRKLEDDEDFDDENDGDDVDDEDYELESSWEKKKMAQQLGQTSVKRIKTEVASQNGVRVVNKSSSDMQIGATLVRKVVGTKSPDVIMAGQRQQSGVFKKASPAAVVQRKPGEGQVRIVGARDQIQSGIVRVGTSPAGNKPNVVTRVVAKASPGQQMRPSPSTGTVVRTVQSVQNQQKTLAQKIIQRSPINKSQSPANRPVAQVVQRQQPTKSPVGTTVVRKAGAPQQSVATRRSGPQTPQPTTRGVAKKGTTHADDEDDGIPDPFPKDLPPLESDSSSPPPPLTLCPITGKVLGQAEGEPSAEEQEAEGESSSQHQITQLLSNEDGTPIYITGDDGTMYQVAGKNANGETILISTNEEGEQTCVLLPADQDLLAGLPGIQTTDASEGALEGAPLTVDAAVAEAVAATEQQEGEQFFSKDGDETSQSGGEEATQPLSIAVGGESGDSQDGQITAEIVQADEPSPGKILVELLKQEHD